MYIYKIIEKVTQSSPAEDKTLLSPAVVNGVSYNDKSEANSAIRESLKSVKTKDLKEIGEYRGFKILASYDSFYDNTIVYLRGNLTYKVGLSGYANIGRFDSMLNKDAVANALEEEKSNLENLYTQKANAEEMIKKPFAQEDELREANTRLNELNILLNNDKNEDEPIESADEELSSIEIVDEGDLTKRSLSSLISSAKSKVEDHEPDRAGSEFEPER